MRIGIYQDLRDPPQWRRGWSVNAGAALERIEEAERLGLDSVWCSEHHFFEDGYLPQPIQWCTAAAARTSRISIGSGIVIAPLHNPLEIAEQAAMVDQISGGRFQLGLGAGYIPREFEAFGADRNQRFQLTESHLIEVKRLLEEGIVTPGPFQSELPIWLGTFGPRGARIAGRNRCGLLCLDGNLLGSYREGLVEGGHDPEAAVMGGITSMILSEDPDRAWSVLEPHIRYFWRSNEKAARVGSDEAGIALMDGGQALARSAGPEMFPPRWDAVTPDEAMRRIGAWLGELPISDLLFFDSIAGMPDELIEEHLSLLASDLAPRLR